MKALIEIIKDHTDNVYGILLMICASVLLLCTLFWISLIVLILFDQITVP